MKHSCEKRDKEATHANVANGLGQSIVPRLLTVKQAAAYISSPVWTVRTIIWRREIKVIRKGKAYLIPIEELDSWIDRTKALL